MGSGVENGHPGHGPTDAPSTGVRMGPRGADAETGAPPARCQGRSTDEFGRRVRPCPRRATVRVTGTHGLTADLCVQHARVAVDRPRLVRDWRLQEVAAGGGAGPAPAPRAGASGEVEHDLIVRVAAQLASITEVRGVLSGVFGNSGWPDDLMPLVVLAVSEALANAIEHGSAPDAAVEVAVTVRSTWAVVRVVDEGRVGAAVPLVTPLRPPPTQTRGRGLLLMLDFAERVEVGVAGSGTSILLRFARSERRPRSGIAAPETPSAPGAGGAGAGGAGSPRGR